MFRTLRKTIVTVVSALAFMVTPLAVPALASAATTTTTTDNGTSIQECLGQGTTLTAPITDTNCSNAGVSGSSTDVNGIIKTVINIFSFVVGVIAVIMIIVGGFRYITSGGDSGNVSSAKNTIIYAIIGLVVVALAQIIVQFVLDKVTTTT